MNITAQSHEYLFQLLGPRRKGQSEIAIDPASLPKVNRGLMCGFTIMDPACTLDYLEMAAQIHMCRLDTTGRGHTTTDHQNLVGFVKRFVAP